jgi:pimeloyl-ACP methyl ester carboxylesterase
MKKSAKKAILALFLILIIIPTGIYIFFPATVFKIALRIERGMAGFTQHGIDIEGWHIEYLEGGQGEPLLLLHGFGGNKDNWTRIGRHLTPYFRVIAPDLPGFGESTRRPDAIYTAGEQIKRIYAFTRALNLQSFHLAGNSMGGYFAGIYAVTHPTDIKTLWLLAPGGVLSADVSEVHQMIKAGKPNPLIAGSTEEYDRLIDLVFVEQPYIPRSIKKHLVREALENRSLNRKIMNQLKSSVEKQALEVLLKGFPRPTLITWGKQDLVLHVSGAGILKSVMPNAEVLIMDRTGHVPMIERPEVSAAGYRQFLKKQIKDHL